MFSKSPTSASTKPCSEAAQAEKLKKAIDNAPTVLIGAGAGLSSAAGLHYAGARFHKIFRDFEEAYGFHDMYSGGFYPYKTPEELWAFWSRYIICNRYEPAPAGAYQRLLHLVSHKDYFVLTTNVDHQFQTAGFDKQRLFYTQGDYGLFQCSVPCCQETFENETLVRRMASEQKNMRIPSELIPYCPHCGSPLTMNLRCDDTFVEDAGWHAANDRYRAFVREHSASDILYLELGVGYNTPGIIKYPFWQMTKQNIKAVYACVNSDEAFCPEEIAGRAIVIQADIARVLELIP